MAELATSGLRLGSKWAVMARCSTSQKRSTADTNLNREDATN